LAREPELLLLDEPTANLDIRAQTEILSLIQDIHRRSNIAMMMVTHEINDLPSRCGRVIGLKGGRIQFDEPRNAAFQNGRLTELFDTPFDVAECDGIAVAVRRLEP
jgi:ABC-type cobalamin/Fe3+-siderophores transport system ATPase subunit